MCAAMDGLVDADLTTPVDDELVDVSLRRDPRPLPPRAGPDPGPRAPDWIETFARRVTAVRASTWISLGVVAACVALVLTVVQWRLVFLTDTIPTGGDMGAHVWGPAYLRDHLLANWRLVGWTPDWYAGFPAFHFYMVVPSLAIVMLGGFGPFAVFTAALTLAFAAVARRSSDAARRRRFVIATAVAIACTGLFAIGMPYGIAFKIVAISGVATLPISAWALGKLSGLPFPGPPILAVATLPFLFDRSFNIYGGNIASTMAGEFAFSMSLSLSVLGLGLAIRALDTGRCRGWAAVVLALAGLCHIFPAVWAAVMVVAYFALSLVKILWRRILRSPDEDTSELGRRAVTQVLSLVMVLLVAAFLGAFWALPFLSKRTYLNDMGWEKLTWFKSYLLTRNQLNPADVLRDSPPLEVVFGIAAVGLLLCVLRRNRLGIVLGLGCAAIAVLFVHMPQLRLWNARMLPFYYLSLYFLCGLALYEAVRLVVERVWARWYVAYAFGGLVLVEAARYAVEGSTWEERLGRILPGEYATTSGALLVGGLATLLAVRRAGARLVFAPALALVWMAATVVPDSWSTGSPFDQGVAVVFHVAQFVAAYGIVGLILVEAIDLVTDTDPLAARPTGAVFRWSSAPLAFIAMWLVFGPALHTLPGGHTSGGKYRWGLPGFELSTTDRSYLDGWAKWNFRGLERKPATLDNGTGGGYPEFRDLVLMTERVGDEYGCGRSMWEYGSRLDSYGTPMAPMLIPHFTDGCVGSMEGLYFEASSTTPFHFITQSALSEKPSSAQRSLAYPGFDMDLGIKELQLLGVRYYLAFTPKAVEAAQANADLQEIDSSGVWHMFLIANSDVVVPLRYSPVVYDNVGETQDEWLQPGVAFFKDPSEYEVLRAASGPDDWPRYTVPEDLKLTPEEISDKQTDANAAGEEYQAPVLPEAPRVELPEFSVSNVSVQRESLEFDVDQIGVPVLVKVSYFPNWKVDGADGPYRVTPNLMVVVPTSTHVRLHYGYNGIDFVAYGLTAIGLVLVALLFRLRPRWPFAPLDEQGEPAPGRPAWAPSDGDAPPASLAPLMPGPVDEGAGPADRAPPPHPDTLWSGAPPPGPYWAPPNGDAPPRPDPPPVP
jgi:hypothetical protein